MNKPKVFICHASEDKDRFVIPFALKLHSNGIDAWIDKWEILPGDSSVDKIFEEGIKEADAFIIILSENSIRKKWVREELNAGIIKKIENGCLLIPVRIDDCKVPEVLKSILWQNINDLNNYEEEFQKILMAIFQKTSKPDTGMPPNYVSVVTDKIDGLNKIDVIIYYRSCEEILNKNLFSIEAHYLSNIQMELGISYEAVNESLEILEIKGYIKTTTDIANKVIDVEITHWSFDRYLRSKFLEYPKIYNEVCYAILNHTFENDTELSLELQKPKIVIQHIIRDLIQKRLVEAFENINGEHYILNVSAEFKRQFH